jgi:hypothetical protein
LRQGESEAFGFPWRLVYLGDPLYRIRALDLRSNQQAVAPSEVSGSRTSPRGGSSWNLSMPGFFPRSDTRPSQRDRLSPRDWQSLAAEYADWPVTEVAGSADERTPSRDRRELSTEDERLRWCLDAAIGELASSPRRVQAFSSSAAMADWRPVLRQLRRRELSARLRPVFDEFLIDALVQTAAFDELQSLLAQIPAPERGPRVWLALESCATIRLALLAHQTAPSEGFKKALDLWDEVFSLAWPAGSPFPAQFTGRLAALAAADAPHRLAAWLDRLRRIGPALASHSGPVPHAAVVAAERARVEAQLKSH